MSATSPAHKRKRGEDSSSASTVVEEEEEVLERVAPDGDVIFVLGGGAQKVQVQSSIMRGASPVFAAMLAGHFREGQMLQEASFTGRPVEIPLPGDNFEAFKLICIAIHRQGNTKQHTPKTPTLMRVLEIADKYNLVDSVSLSIEFWARRYVLDPTAGHFMLMIICHQIKSQELFQLFSRSLVLGHWGSFMTLATNAERNICESVPRETIYKLACSLEEMRATMMRRITSLLHAEMMFRFKNGASDKAMASDVIPYYRLLRSALDSYSRNPGIHRVGHDHSVNDLVAQITKIETSFQTEDGKLPNNSATIELYRALLRRLRVLNETFTGLCLECLEANKLNFDCRGVHR
ncbi:hypothetical protein ACHAPT_004231 [Fusarium lateritium]